MGKIRICFLLHMSKNSLESDVLFACILLNKISVDGYVVAIQTQTKGSMLGWSQMLTDRGTDKKTDPYITPCLRQARQKKDLNQQTQQKFTLPLPNMPMQEIKYLCPTSASCRCRLKTNCKLPYLDHPHQNRGHPHQQRDQRIL